MNQRWAQRLEMTTCTSVGALSAPGSFPSQRGLLESPSTDYEHSQHENGQPERTGRERGQEDAPRDAATHHLCTGGGLDWISLRDQYGVIGMPLVDTGASFRQPASFGDHLEIESSVVECARKTLRLRHLVRRGDTLLVEGFEVRVLGARHPDDPKRLRALEIPEKIRNALTRREDGDRTR